MRLFNVCLFQLDAPAGNGFVDPGYFLFGIRMKIAEHGLVCHFHRRQIWHELFIDERHKRFLERGRDVCLYHICRRVFVAHLVKSVLRLTDLRKDFRYAVKFFGGLLRFVLAEIREQAFDEGRFRRIARRHNGFSVFGENGVELLRRFVFGGKLANHWPLTTSSSNATDFFKKFLEEAFIYLGFPFVHFNEDLQKSHNLCENSIYKQCGAVVK